MFVTLLDEAPRLHKLLRWAAFNVHALTLVDGSAEAGHCVAVETFMVERRLLLPKPRSTNQ